MFGRKKVQQLKDDKKSDKLLEYLKHRNSNIRVDALIAFFDINSDNSEELEKARFLLKDKEQIVRNRCALLFARYGDTSVIDNFQEIISGGSPGEQIELLRVLPHYYSKDDDRITQILAIALKDKKTAIQAEAVRTIGEMEMETMAFYLLDFVNHSNSRIRHDAVVALGRTRNSMGLDALIGSLTDSSAEVRKAAEEAIRYIGDEKGVSSLKDAPFMLMVKNMNESVAKRLTTVVNIGKQRKECGLPLLHKACYDEYKSIRLEAIKSMSLLRNSQSISTLIELLSDKYYDVRIEAIRALAKYNTESALNAVKKAMNDPNTNVKNEAKKTFSSMNLRIASINERKY
ncbi:MAG TPA: HEAT repeat domain-containing protein [Spirochaetota bacterium]|nr:HEAT repeat domain-containing protein [Spirochaetota bacterium]HPR37158.1 HEAT repeat domain-containing protein [Spirochaetota bacterium]